MADSNKHRLSRVKRLANRSLSPRHVPRIPVLTKKEIDEALPGVFLLSGLLLLGITVIWYLLKPE